MNIPFKKSHLPFLKRTLHGEASPRDFRCLARLGQDRDGLTHQLPAELSLLARGAAAGDIWSVCELARNYFDHDGDLLLPEALGLWRRAALVSDPGTLWDLENRPIESRILAYRDPLGNDYATVEAKLAMLTEYHLSRLGLAPFEEADEEACRARCLTLSAAACRVIGIPEVSLSFVPGLTLEGRCVDGLAGWDGKVAIRAELLFDTERLVEVLFHELGHIVTFEIRKRAPWAEELKTRYGITEERIASWEKNAPGLEVPTAEEDPDTLSYGVYTLWATFFLPRAKRSIP